MDTRHYIIRLALLGCLCLIPLAGQAQQIKPGIFIEFRKDSVKTGLFHATKADVDTGNALTRAYIKRLADSVAALRTTNDYTIVRLYGALGTTASDSVNLQVGVNGVYEAMLLNYNMYAFNFALVSTQPSNIVSTFRQDLLPMVSGDSLYIFRVSRNVAMTDTCAITIYKVPVATGPDVNDKTAGTFYDMVRFSGLKLTNSANKFFTVDVALRRKP